MREFIEFRDLFRRSVSRLRFIRRWFGELGNCFQRSVIHRRGRYYVRGFWGLSRRSVMITSLRFVASVCRKRVEVCMYRFTGVDVGVRVRGISTGSYSKILELPKRELDGRETRRRWRVHPFLVARR